MSDNETSTKPRLTVFLIVIVIVVAGAVLLVRRTLKSPVEVVLPMRGPAIQAVYATGTVEAEIMIPIATRGAAWLTKLNVDEGAEVTKGQLMAELENEDIRNSLAALRAKEKFAKSEHERNIELLERDAVSRQTFERSKSELESAQAASAEAQAHVDYMNLTAPADGTVIRRDGEVGQLIAANQAVFWLSAKSPLRISAEVDEEDIAQVKVGQAVAIRADAFTGKVFKGKVKSITPKGDPVARSYRVRIELIEVTPLQIGMTAETNIIVEEHLDAQLLPTSAIVGDKVWIEDGGRLRQQPVEVGIKGVMQAEILSGLSMDERVVVNPTVEFKAGMKVDTVLLEQKD